MGIMRSLEWDLCVVIDTSSIGETLRRWLCCEYVFYGVLFASVWKYGLRSEQGANGSYEL